MKKIYILLTIIVGFTLNACNDLLDTKSTSQADSGTIVTNITELENAIAGIYYIQVSHQTDEVGLGGTYVGEFTLHADLLGGDFESPATNNQMTSIGQYGVDPTHKITQQYFAKFYLALGQTNDIISKLDMVQYSEDDKAIFNNCKGELYALRALFHFDLARLYAKLPSTVSDLTAPESGIPLSDQVFAPNQKFTRSTLKDTYDFILSDLETALGLLDKTITPQESLGHINYWGAKAIKARALLYLEDNANALKEAKDIIENSPYKLYTTSNYKTVWITEGSDESIFEIRTTGVYNAQRNGIGYYTSYDNGYGEVGFTKSFKTFLDSQENDIRKEIQSFQEVGDYPTKYPGREGQVYINNPKVVRLSEAYLIAAEAAFKTSGGSSADALKYYNGLRKNRIEKYTDVTSVTLEDILNERRLELFAEGHGAWDFWRNKLSINNTSAGVINYDNNKTILPFPAREIELNPDLKQNPQ